MYENKENIEWFSQTLMTYKDKVYGTDGYLRISLSTNTEDYKFFNPPLFNLSISNNYQKSYNLNYHNASDLLQTLRLVKTQTNGNNSEIQRKYQKNMMLYIKFFVESNNKNSVVDIRLLSNETDFTKIIIPVEIFATLGKCLRYYVDNFFELCTKLLGQSIQSKSNQIIHQLPSLIKGISSQIVGQEISPDSPRSAPEVVEHAVKTKATIADLDKFLGDDMENITVAELEEKKKPLVEVDSIFVKRVLKNDLSNFESMLNNHSINPDPILTLSNEIQNTIEPYIKGEFSMLPGISDDDMKSLLYMSKVFYNTSYLNHLINNKALPLSIPVFKYNNKIRTPENQEIAYDLFLFSLYIRCIRSRLEGKTSDIITNKALFHIQLRCFTDVFVFSFIGKDDIENLNSIISNRYKYFDSIGVFDKYKQMLIDNKCPEIKDFNISSAVDEVIDKVIGKCLNIMNLHDKVHDNFRLPSKNTFNLEQIINEIIPLEVAEKIGKDITNKEVFDEIDKNTPISNEISNFFFKNKTKVGIKKENIFSSNLERIVNFYSDEIPEQYKDNFIEWIKSHSEIKIDLSKDEFPFDEFGDNIVRALYLWDPQGDPKTTKSYKYFQMKIQEELMEKKLILAKINVEDNKESNSGDWNFLSE